MIAEAVSRFFKKDNNFIVFLETDQLRAEERGRKEKRTSSFSNTDADDDDDDDDDESPRFPAPGSISSSPLTQASVTSSPASAP